MKQIQKVLASVLAIVLMVSCFSITTAAASAKKTANKLQKRTKEVSQQVSDLGDSLENTAEMIGTEPDENELATTDFKALYRSYAAAFTGELTLTAEEFRKDYEAFLEKNFNNINKKILLRLGIDASEEGEIMLKALSTFGDGVTHGITNGIIAIMGGAAALLMVFFNGICMPFLTVRSGPRVINYFGPKAYAALYHISNDTVDVVRNNIKR